MNDGNEVLTIIRIGMETQYYLLKGAVKSILQLIQFMKKMEKTGLLKGKEMNNFNSFIKKTEGQFQLLNIPTEQAEELAGMRENFKKLGITYIVLPDLNPNDGMTQIAYYVPHTNKVEAWYQNFCINHLQGGEKDSIKLRNLTEGNTSIVSIPWEGEVGKLREDLDRLKINYAVLPDLNIGDGYVQVMYANADAPNIRAWFELYQKEMADFILVGLKLKISQKTEEKKSSRENTGGKRKTPSQSFHSKKKMLSDIYEAYAEGKIDKDTFLRKKENIREMFETEDVEAETKTAVVRTDLENLLEEVQSTADDSWLTHEVLKVFVKEIWIFPESEMKIIWEPEWALEGAGKDSIGEKEK